MSTTVTDTHKPPQVVAPATATVEADAATYDEVIDAGLEALRETRDSLFGYGITGLPRQRQGTESAPLSGTFTVYADRD